ncbi:MAG TPA: glycoside hydrolase family 15 protein [Mycobacteriales bacterium]|nr:glycoside hydrolase family 15 protein [Mycobacteriales bacterium]
MPPARAMLTIHGDQYWMTHPGLERPPAEDRAPWLSTPAASRCRHPRLHEATYLTDTHRIQDIPSGGAYHNRRCAQTARTHRQSSQSHKERNGMRPGPGIGWCRGVSRGGSRQGRRSCGEERRGTRTAGRACARAGVTGMAEPSIGDYALVSDCQSAALVSRAGSVDWLCLPRFDAHPVFARLLDPAAGHWSIRPVDDGTGNSSGGHGVERQYLDRTMVLRTTFRSPTATIRLTDALATGEGERGHELGRHSPHVLLRLVECESGVAEVDVQFAPRPGYGPDHPRVETARDGGIVCGSGEDTVTLTSAVGFDLRDGTARTRLALRAGDRVGFALHYRPPGGRPPAWGVEEVAAALDRTVATWRSWAGLHQSYEGPWQHLVLHSGRVLQALTYAPTGAVVAAPTMSLPETPGGERNYDYRYAWVRDAALTLNALWVAACPDEAKRFFGWMVDSVGRIGDGERLQVMFDVTGGRELHERTLGHLRGYRDSRPVRVGNDAWRQYQTDVYGELLLAAHTLRDQLGGFDEPLRRFLVGLADDAARHWREPDQGIWEVRGPPRHFLYSKVMCWAALDRAIALAPDLGAGDRVAGWTATREQIHAAIEEHGWNASVGAYTQAFGSDVLDAAVLAMPTVGYTAAGSPRMRATIDAVQERLTDHRGLVFRYLDADDGFGGREGTFVLCTFWLAHCLALVGEVDRARALFDTAAAHANDVGLFSEEIDPTTGGLLGNHPQAFSHIGLVNAAWAIAQADG